MAGALMLLIPSLAGAQALPFTASDTDPVILGKGGAGLTETETVAHAAFTNAAVIPFSESKLDVSAGYMLWQPSSVKSNVISVGAAYKLKDKLGVAAGLYYGMNPKFTISNAGGLEGGTYRPSDIHAAVGVSYRFLDFMSAGINLGYAGSILMEDVSYGAVSADLFLMAKLNDFKLTAGVANALGSIKDADGNKFSLPASLAVGMGFRTALNEAHEIEASLDMDYFFEGSFAAAVGMEYIFNDFVTARVGYRDGGNSAIPSFTSIGAGVKRMGLRLDLAYLIGTSDSPMRNTLALGLGYSF